MKNLINNYFYNVVYQLLTLIIPLITAPYLSRVIGAEGIGKYSYAYSTAYYFFILIKLGLDNYGNRCIAKCSNKEERSKTFFSIYSFQLITGILIISLYFVYSFTLALDKKAALYMIPYVVSGIFDITWFFNGIEKFKLTVVRNTMVKIVTTISIFLFVKSATDVFVYIRIMALGFLASQLIMWPFVKNETIFVKPSIPDILKHIKPNLILFIAVAAVSLYRYMDKIMLGAVINEYEVGIYENSERILQIPINFVNALGIVMIPRMSKAINEPNNKETIKNVILLSEVFVCFLSTSIGLGILGISNVLIPMFYGKGFERCVDVLYILLPS